MNYIDAEKNRKYTGRVWFLRTYFTYAFPFIYFQTINHSRFANFFITVQCDGKRPIYDRDQQRNYLMK